MSAIVTQKMPFSKYIKLPGLHSTGLRHMLVSPLHYQHHKTHPMTDTPSLKLGRAVHTSVFEPDRFALEYAVWKADENGEHRRRAGKVWDAFCEANSDRTILSEDDYMQAVAMREAVRSHKQAGALLREGNSEVTIQWTDEASGLPCKARIDHSGSTALIDLKSSRDVTPHAFSNASGRLNYAMQLAFYKHACDIAGLHFDEVKIIAVQSTEPHDVVVYKLEDALIAYGTAQFRTAIDRIVACTAANAWPGIAPDDELPLQLPNWIENSADDELTFDGASLF